MTWGDESDEQGIKFREMEIPQGVPDREGELLQTKLTAPQEEAIAPKGRSTARNTTDAISGQAAKQNLRPRHREVVKKYFGSGGED